MNIRDTLYAFTTIVVLWTQFVESKILNEYIKHYEGLTYDADKIHNLHQRAKRSTDLDSQVHVKFKALGRSFHLRLKRDTSTFSKYLQLELPDGSTVDHQVTCVYEGYLKGEPNSTVHGSIIQGMFEGQIQTIEGTYYVEKSNQYFREAPGFHSVIYRSSDVDSDPHRLKRATDSGVCGNQDASARQWMEEVQSSAKPVRNNPVKRELKNEETLSRPAYHPNMYSASHNRQKRNTDSLDNKRTCTLFLQSDPYLWKYMTDSKAKKGLEYDEDRALEEITSLFGLHVKGIKNIYEGTYFKSGDLSYRGFSFVVRRIKIMKMSECDSGSLVHHRFCEPHIDVTNFLNLNSLTNHNEYCLAYVFTYRDFTGGTLGLAWVGSPSRASGGICEQWKEYTEGGKDTYKSLNTGIVTLVNYNSRVPPKVSTLTFAHEVGHNFGSPHDAGSDCTPFTSKQDKAGNYIMFASATSGERPNNSKFSSCSKANMTLVVDAIIHTKFTKKNCFVDPEEAFCGNNIKEEGELCDCGYHEDCTDQCCYGRGDPDIQCRLTPDVVCSPSAGPCCDNSCNFKGKDTSCQSDQDCTMESFCNGRTAECPLPVHKANNTFCNDNSQICVAGECQGSICAIIGWEQCYLTAPPDDKDFDKGNLCFVACKNPDTEKCVSSSPNNDALDDEKNFKFKDFLETAETPDGAGLSKGVKLPPGAPCDNFQGYCDVFQKCRGVDADGPLARLKNLLFSEETLSTVRNWIISRWWAVLLMALCLVILMAIFIYVCSVHTPSSNPNRPPARKVSLKPNRNKRARGPPQPYPGTVPGSAPHYGGGDSRGNRPPPYAPGDQFEMKHHGGAGRV